MSKNNSDGITTAMALNILKVYLAQSNFKALIWRLLEDPWYKGFKYRRTSWV